MSGPVASVLLKHRLTEIDRSKIRNAISSLVTPHPDKAIDLSDFLIDDSSSIGGHYKGAGQPFSVSLGQQTDWEPEQWESTGEAFGFKTEDEIFVCAYCNGDENHRVLAELCIYFAEEFDGIIYFGGALWPHPLPTNLSSDLASVEWTQLEPYFLKMIDNLPGRIFSMPYETAGGHQWVSHVADVAFLRAWLRHPRFHMVK